MTANNQPSGWELLQIFAANEKRGTLGTIRKSSKRIAPDKTPDRDYGGTHMSVARVTAYGPRRQHTPILNHDITM